MLTVKFALHDALSIVLQSLLLVCPLSFKLLLPQLVFQVRNVLPGRIDLLILLINLRSKLGDLLIQPLLVQVATSWDNTPSITLLMEIPGLCPLPRPLPLVQGAFTLPLPMPNLSEIRVSLYIYLT